MPAGAPRRHAAGSGLAPASPASPHAGEAGGITPQSRCLAAVIDRGCSDFLPAHPRLQLGPAGPERGWLFTARIGKIADPRSGVPPGRRTRIEQPPRPVPAWKPALC